MKQQTRRTIGVILAAAALGPLGCASLYVRGARSPAPDGIYPGLRQDGQNIAACFTGATGFHQRGPLAKALGYTVVPLCWILDTPVSAVVDTACLPKDWRRKDAQAPSPARADPPER